MLKNKIKGNTRSSYIALAIAAGLVGTIPTAHAEETREAEFVTMEEVVVSARRRDESLQDVPLSVVALGGEALAERNIDNLIDLNTHIPNLTIGTGGGFGGNISSIFIRGMGQDRSATAAEPGVGTYIDGVFLGESDGALLDLVDVERVEVLRGPQGTLFGKNSIGGLINYVSKKPSDELEGRFKVTGGKFSRLDVEGYVNLPISDTLAARVSAASKSRDGHVIDVFDPSNPVDLGNSDTQAIRGQLRWQASDAVEVNISADYVRDKSNGAPFNIIASNPTAPALAGSGEPVPILTGDLFVSQLSADTFIDYEGYGIHVTIDWDLGNASLKSITAYREFTSDAILDFDGSNAVLRDEVVSRTNNQFQQELQLQGELFEDQLTYVVGAFFFTSNPFDERFQTRNSIGNQGFVFQQEVDSFALFGEANYNITDEFTITAGLRQTWEESTLDATRIRADVLAGSASENFNNFDYRFSAQYRPNDEIMVYGSIATGFKSGGFNDRTPNPGAPFDGLNPYDEETATSYEIGTRTNLLDNRLMLNATIFHTDYTNLHLPIIIGDDVRVDNAGGADIDGVEIDMVFQVTDNFVINGALGWLDARITDDADNEDIPEGTQLARSPEWAFSIGGEYTFDLQSSGFLIVRADYGWKDDYRLVQPVANEVIQEAFGLLSARLTYKTEDENIAVSLFGTNLTNETYFRTGLDLFNTPFAATTVGVARPIEWGLSVEVNF